MQSVSQFNRVTRARVRQFDKKPNEGSLGHGELAVADKRQDS